MTSVFKITPSTQKYDWGKIGKESKVAQLAVASNYAGFTLDEGAPYAELWMGTHPNAPSHLSSAKQTLSSYLASNPHLIGQKVIDRFPDASNGNLPFLFKVLSIEKALSIQTHPDKATAEKLHAEQPNVYKDPNHKPEMALAITPFKALCGFLPLPLIARNLTSTPELTSLIPPTIASAFLTIACSPISTNPPAEKAALRDLFAALMTAPEDQVKIQLDTLVKRLKAAGTSDEIAHLVIRLDSQFPGDIGVFCAYMLNYVTLKPGEAIYLGAGEPHAYVQGEIMECMANSDNVIRAGLTPKLRDIPNLVSGLTYIAAPATKHVVIPQPLDGDSGSSSPSTTLYDPPIPEFSVLQTILPRGDSTAHRVIDGPSIAIVLRGAGKVRWGGGEELQIGMGDVFFVGAGTELKIEEHGSEDDLAIYRAFVEA